MRFTALLAAFVFLVGMAVPVLAVAQTQPAASVPAASSTSSQGSDSGSFYNSGIQMGTQFCPGATYDCDTLAVEQTSIISAANSCIKDRFNISDDIMSTFQSSGQFENCVTPARQYDGGGGTSWAVCCVKKSSEGQCNLFCTRYIGSR